MTIVLSAFVIVALACALPGWALLVRRLHDADLSGWLPYAGAIRQIVFGVLPPKPMGYRFDRRWRSAALRQQRLHDDRVAHQNRHRRGHRQPRHADRDQRRTQTDR